jgi:8-oxo-dGTP pyrophosphatase MutT (NUDIX family)
LKLFAGMNRAQLTHRLQHYETPFEEELLFVPRFLSLIINFPDCYRRSLASGHITASAWIVNREQQAILLVHHRKLGRWLQPGGHADGEEDVMSVAYREAVEETGLARLRPVSKHLFDIDIHRIPRHGDIAPHLHYDVRFLFESESAELQLNSRESHEVAWVSMKKVVQITKENASIVRMMKKTAHLLKSVNSA